MQGHAETTGKLLKETALRAQSGNFLLASNPAQDGVADAVGERH